MSQVDTAFSSLAELRLWFNDQSGIPLTLADMPEIIPLRWAYFRDNWEFVVDGLKEKISSYSYPDLLDTQIEKLSKLIRVQRHEANKRVNPFAKQDILSTYYAVWENIQLDSIPLTKEEDQISTDKVNRIRRFITTDFKTIRTNLVNGRDEIADVVGLSDVDYNDTFNRSSTRQLRDSRIRDVGDMQTLQQSIAAVDYILANTGSLTTTNVDPFALARANANNPDIDIRTGRSGYLVRMFFGDSLQALANRYLGSPDRWIEIAIANGLKAPYVDETGEPISLISNGNGSQINIAGSNGGLSNRNKIFVNQVIFLQSDSVKFPDQRTILDIREIPISGELILELSGEANLAQYLTSESAYIRVFKPNTINSNFMVMLPSEDSTQNQSTKETPFFLASKGEDEKRAGVDLLLNQDNDLALTAFGDLQLNYGIANAQQAMQLKLIAEQGQIPRHPTYGLPPILGTKASDPSAIKNALVTGINDMVSADSRFDRIETLNVSVEQGSAIISLVVRMAGSGSLIPLNFRVNTG